MNLNKVRDFCSVFRIIVGSGLIAYAALTANYWFLLGIIPLIAGMTKFCPICIVSGKCDLPAK